MHMNNVWIAHRKPVQILWIVGDFGINQSALCRQRNGQKAVQQCGEGGVWRGHKGGIASKRATLNAKVNIASALAFHTFTADGKSRSCAIDLNNLSLSPALSLSFPLSLAISFSYFGKRKLCFWNYNFEQPSTAAGVAFVFAASAVSQSVSLSLTPRWSLESVGLQWEGVQTNPKSKA